MKKWKEAVREAADSEMKKIEELKQKGRGKKLLRSLIMLLLFVIITNPSILPLPAGAKARVLEVWTGVFGDVEQISRTITVNWISLFKVAVICLFMVVIVNLYKFISSKFHPKKNKWKSIMSMLDSMILYAAVLVGLIWSLSAIGVNLSTIIASIGIVALIIGFAAESLIEDVITGIFLVFEDDFNVGDIVEIDGFRGTVISIGVRVTSIRNGGGNIKVVNNSDIRDVLNKSKARSVAVVDVPVSYDASLEECEKILGEIVAKLPEDHPDIFKTVPRYLGVEELASSAVLMRYAADVAEDDIYAATRLMNRDIKVGMDRAGLEIPFNQLVIHQSGK